MKIIVDKPLFKKCRILIPQCTCIFSVHCNTFTGEAMLLTTVMMGNLKMCTKV